MLAVRTDIRNYLEEVVRIQRRILIDEKLSRYYRKPTTEHLARQIQASSRWNPLESFVVETSSGEVLAYGYAWSNEFQGASYLRFGVDPTLEEGLYIDILRTILRWAKSLHYVERWARGPFTVYGGARYGRRYRSILRLLGPYLIEVPGYNVMVYEGAIINKNNNINDISIDILRFPVSTEDLKGIVETYNDAFSVYIDYSPWPIDSALKYYQNIYKSREKYVIVIARHGDNIIGVAEGPIYENLHGELVAYVVGLAVRRSWQRRGIGRSLLHEFSKIATREGDGLVVLDSEPGAVRVYEKLGFRMVAENTKFRGHVQVLPG